MTERSVPSQMRHQRNSDLHVASLAETDRGDPIDAALLAGFVLALAWAPYWLGGNRPFAWGVNGVIFPAMTLVYECGVLIGARRHAVGLATIAAPAGLFFVALVYVVAQTLTFPPLAHPIWEVAGEALG
ncbi:MAG: hypothetical protein N2444_07245, partial [Methylocystis sp.]|nr:hypothetical protein [Methylocystis sp.]